MLESGSEEGGSSVGGFVNDLDDRFTLRDINSRTNLIEMEMEDQQEMRIANEPGKHLTATISLPVVGQAASSNNSSQASIATSRLGDNLDLIPLMPMLANGKFINGTEKSNLKRINFLFRSNYTSYIFNPRLGSRNY